MAFFSKRKRNEEFKKQLEREALDKMDQGGILPYESMGVSVGGGQPHHHTAAHVITVAELKGERTEPTTAPSMPKPVTGEPIAMAPESSPATASDFLYQRMTEARQAATERYTAFQRAPQAATVSPAQAAATAMRQAEAAGQHSADAAPAVKRPDGFKPQPAAAPAANTEKQVAKQPAAAPVKKQEEPFDLNAAINSLKNAAGLMAGPNKSVQAPASKAPDLNSGVKATNHAAVEHMPAQQPPAASVKSGVGQAGVINPQPKAAGNAAKPFAQNKSADPANPQQISKSIDQDVSKIAAAHAAAASAEQRRKTLLDRCNAYLADDSVGVVQPDTSRYKLESVESILSGFEDRATQKVLRSLNLPMPEKVETAAKVGAAAPSEKSRLPEKTPEKPQAAESTEISSSPVTVAEQLPDSGTVKHISFQNPTAPRAAAAKLNSLAADGNTRHIELDPAKMPPAAAETHFDATQTFKKFKEQEPVQPQEPVENQDRAEAPETEAMPTADYRTVGDRDAVNAALSAAGKKLRLRAFANVVLLGGGLLFSTLLKAPVLAAGETAYYTVHLLLTVLVIAVNFPVLKGLKSFVSKQKSIDSSLAAAFVMVLLQSMLAVAGIRSQGAFPLSAPLALSAAFYSFGRLSAHRRVCANFGVIANEKLKNAVHVVSNHSANLAMGQRAVGDDVLVCCGSKTKNIEDFLAYSYCKNPLINRAKKVALVGLIMSLGLGLAAAFITTLDIAYAVFVAGVVSCIAAAPATLLIPNYPLRSAAKRLNGYGAMLTGYKACAELDRCNAVAVTAGQLFPEDSVCMVDMRPLSPNPIDRTILDAYSVTAQIGSPLAGMFRQINNTTDLVPKKADTVMYEEKMGVSGWVENHRVFVGNRVLMEAHGFKALPPLELDKKILRKGYFPVYLACDNAVCAIFVVKYCPNEEVAYELSRLCNTGTTVLVKNCDPNLSEKMLCDYFGLYEDSISIMNKQGCDRFDTAVAYKESRSAGASFGKSVCGLFAGMTAAIQIKSLFHSMSALYVVTVILGILATAVAIFAAPSLLSMLYFFIYQLLATVLVCLPALLKRP